MIRVLYEDDYFVIFDKPSGLLVIATPRQEKNILTNVVNAQYTAISEKSPNNQKHLDKRKLYPCHRLDRDTSGAIIFAKGKANQQLMMNEFRQMTVRKKYIAFARGQMPERQGEITLPIRDIRKQKFVKKVPAKASVTLYKVKSVKKEFSVVEVFPQTGRTNQIRIHFSKIGHPLLGERVYAYGKDFPVKFRRLALHASELNWTHPVKKKQIKVKSDLPEDMRKFLEKHVAG